MLPTRSVRRWRSTDRNRCFAQFTAQPDYCLAGTVDEVSGSGLYGSGAFTGGAGAPVDGCKRGGFEGDFCPYLKSALFLLRTDRKPLCRDLGVSATRRFDIGKVRYNPIYERGIAGKSELSAGIMWLGLDAFHKGELMNTIAHEEFHLRNPDITLPNLPGELFPDNHWMAYAAGDYCAGLA